jgi:hypothetical protein
MEREKRRSPIAQRVIRAMKLDPFLYRTVADQPSLTVEAVAVAIVSSLVMVLGLMLVRSITPFWWVVSGIGWGTAVLGLGTWFVVAVGRRLGGKARYDQMLRALGYAMAPQALGFIPIANFVPGFLAGGVWATTCTVIAVREVHDMDSRLAATLVVAPILMFVGILPLVVIATQASA